MHRSPNFHARRTNAQPPAAGSFLIALHFVLVRADRVTGLELSKFDSQIIVVSLGQTSSRALSSLSP